MSYLRLRVRQALLRGVVAGFLGISMVPFAAPTAASAAGTACTAPAASPSVPTATNIDTTQGCDATTGAASNPATGWLTVTFPAQSTGAFAQLVDYFQAGPTGAVYAGSYTLTFGACTSTAGTPIAGPGTYTVDSNGVPAGTSAAWNAQSTAGPTMSCPYTLAFTGTPPAGVTTLQNVAQFQILNGVSLTPVTARSAVVGSFAAPPVPEVPLAVGLPLAGALVVGAYAVWSRRRPRLQLQSKANGS